jgi:hypothetical protein
MRTIAIIIFAATGLAACTSPAEIRANAYEHQLKAKRLEAQGDYGRAAKERAAADKQYRKAQARAYDQQHGYF